MSSSVATPHSLVFACSSILCEFHVSRDYVSAVAVCIFRSQCQYLHLDSGQGITTTIISELNTVWLLPITKLGAVLNKKYSARLNRYLFIYAI